MSDKRALLVVLAMVTMGGASLAGCDSDDDGDGSTTQSTSSTSSAGGASSSTGPSSSASTGATGATGGGGAGATGGDGGNGGVPAGGAGGAGGTGGDASGGAGGSGGSAGAQLVINEVTHSPEGDGQDWVEFYNAGNAPADIGGWYFTDDDPTHVFTFAAGTTLAPGAYLVLTRDEPDSFDFGLGGGGDAVMLYDALDALVDSTTWVDGEGAEPGSWGRTPNGTGAFASLPAVSPGAANP